MLKKIYKQDERGQIVPTKTRKGRKGFRIELLKDADASTFMHEFGHFGLEMMAVLADDKEGGT